jgi:hypothetical protein
MVWLFWKKLPRGGVRGIGKRKLFRKLCLSLPKKSKQTVWYNSWESKGKY